MSMMPEIVLATPSWKNSSAMKLNAAAHSTATRGDSTRDDDGDDDDGGHRSGMLEDHAFDDVGDVLAAVTRRLEALVDLFPLDHHEHVLLFLEKPCDRAAQD